MPGATDVRLVVLDWAGTTLDFGCLAPAGAFVEAFADLGVAVSVAEARGPMGLHKKDHLRALLRNESVASKWFAVHARPSTDADVDELYRLVTPLQIVAATAYSTLCPGVLDCVAALRDSGLMIAGTTGYFRAAAEACYTAAATQGYTPDFCVCADEVSAGRPAPWMIFRCMEALNVYPPRAVVKVGDTRTDIEDGVNAGVWSIGVVDSSNEMGLSRYQFAVLADEEKESRRAAIREIFYAAGADGVIDSLHELPELIGELNRLLAEPEE